MLALFTCTALCTVLTAQNKAVHFTNTDTALQTAFNWAKATALQYRGNAQDAVGPWYEAALPSRNAFCVRDFSHQCIAAAALGMQKENENMLQQFIRNISASKDWCTYWEIDKWNKPCPADYKNDSAFWYNLNANFELLYTSERLYQWTGNRTLINAPATTYFLERTLNEYIRKWQLQPGSLLTRPGIANKRSNYKAGDNYTGYRGLPSYVESVDGLLMSADLLAAMYRACISGAFISRIENSLAKSKEYLALATGYQKQLQQNWKNGSSYSTFYTADGKFGTGEGALFLLWYNALQDVKERKAIIEQLLALQLNVESQSYLPRILYQHGYGGDARNIVLHLANPATKRREYPEVSFGIVEGIVQGLMGIDAVASSNTVTTCNNSQGSDTAAVTDLSLLNTTISLVHNGSSGSVITNTGSRAFNWTAVFKGSHRYIFVDGKRMRAESFIHLSAEAYSRVTVKIKPGRRVEAGIK